MGSFSHYPLGGTADDPASLSQIGREDLLIPNGLKIRQPLAHCIYFIPATTRAVIEGHLQNSSWTVGELSELLI